MKTHIEKYFPTSELLARLETARQAGKKIVFTNGCFDILHVGHVWLMQAAKDAGDVLVVAINSDASVRRLGKGDDRPIHPQDERAELLSALAAVDFVIVFDEPTPYEILQQVQPDVLVKGGDWGADQIVGRDLVEARGGKVIRVPLVAGRSTTKLVEQLRTKNS